MTRYIIHDAVYGRVNKKWLGVRLMGQFGVLDGILLLRGCVGTSLIIGEVELSKL